MTVNTTVPKRLSSVVIGQNAYIKLADKDDDTLYMLYDDRIPLVFDANGGTIGDASVVTRKLMHEVSLNGIVSVSPLINPQAYKNAADALNIPVPTRSGYRFIGWCTNTSNKSGFMKGTPIAYTSGSTLYARWLPESVYGMPYLNLNDNCNPDARGVLFIAGIAASNTIGASIAPYRRQDGLFVSGLGLDKTSLIGDGNSRILVGGSFDFYWNKFMPAAFPRDVEASQSKWNYLPFAQSMALMTWQHPDLSYRVATYGEKEYRQAADGTFSIHTATHEYTVFRFYCDENTTNIAVNFVNGNGTVYTHDLNEDETFTERTVNVGAAGTIINFPIVDAYGYIDMVMIGTWTRVDTTNPGLVAIYDYNPTSIANGAFNGCNQLTYVNCGNATEIGQNAFNTELSNPSSPLPSRLSVYAPKVTKIVNSAFVRVDWHIDYVTDAAITTNYYAYAFGGYGSGSTALPKCVRLRMSVGGTTNSGLAGLANFPFGAVANTSMFYGSDGTSTNWVGGNKVVAATLEGYYPIDGEFAYELANRITMFNSEFELDGASIIDTGISNFEFSTANGWYIDTDPNEIRFNSDPATWQLNNIVTGVTHTLTRWM